MKLFTLKALSINLTFFRLLLTIKLHLMKFLLLSLNSPVERTLRETVNFSLKIWIVIRSRGKNINYENFPFFNAWNCYNELARDQSNVLAMAHSDNPLRWCKNTKNCIEIFAWHKKPRLERFCFTFVWEFWIVRVGILLILMIELPVRYKNKQKSSTKQVVETRRYENL